MDNTQIQRLETHIKYGWIAGLTVSVVISIFAIIGMFNDTYRLEYGYDAWSFLDVAFILSLTFGIYKKNRFCALFLTFYFVINNISVAVDTGQYTGGILTFVFGYYFFRATIATFKHHKYSIESGLKEKKKTGIPGYFGIAFISIAILVVGILFYLTAVGPDLEVVPGKMMKSQYMSLIRELELLDGDEQIIYWYSDAITDVEEGFYFFTENKVVIYSKYFENPAIIVPYEEIHDIKFTHEPSFWTDSQISLILRDSTEVFFPVSSEHDGDKKFNEKLKSMWKKKIGG